MSEDDLLRAVLATAALYGWKRAHFRPGMNRREQWQTAVAGDGVGFPDLLLLKGARLLVVELKSEKGKHTPSQELWLRAWEPFASLVTVWRPIDWTNGSILAELKGTK